MNPRLIPVILLLLLVCGSSLYAGGRAEHPLDRIDTLINERQYDQAIQALVTYMRDTPDDFDRAHLRIQQIIAARSSYNGVTRELLDTIANDPSNMERILVLTQALEGMETARNPQTQNFLGQTQSLAQFTVNRKLLEDILQRGRALTAEGKFREALRVYESGLDIYQDEFFTLGYGNEIEAPVRYYIFQLARTINSFESSTTSLDARSLDLRSRGTALSTVSQTYGQIKADLNALIDTRGRIEEAGKYFVQQLQYIQEADMTMGDRSFLSFSSRLIYGTSGDEQQGGMLYVVETYWDYTVEVLELALESLAADAYDEAMASARNRNYREAQADFEGAAAYSALAGDLLDTNRIFWEQGGQAVEQIFDTPVLAGDLQHFLAQNSRDFALVRAREVELLELQLVELAAREDDDSGQFNLLLAETDRMAGELEAREGTYRSLGAGVSYTGDALGLLADFRSRCLNLAFDRAVVRYTRLNGELQQRLESRLVEFNTGDRLLTGLARDDAVDALVRAGVNSPAPPGPAGGLAGNVLYYYPREAQARFGLMGSAIQEDVAAAAALLARYEGERPEFALPALVALRSSAQTMAADLENLRRRGDERSKVAAASWGRADTLRGEGDRYYQEARTAVGQDNFTSARNRIQLAAERYNGSLSLQESSSLRQEWDTRMLALGQEISQRENEVVVREVREIVNSARGAYFAGNFEDAQDMLVRGQNRWQVTNVDENTEINYWLSMVRGALSLRSGRNIPVTAPLFTEMGQLLDEARRSYAEGVLLIQANRRSEALTRFSYARQKTREIKLIFPVNQDAGMLELRMDQVTDPDAFNASFQRRLNEAIAGTKRRSAESFADLQNLAELNPRYPGIADALSQAEIDMGYRTAPPDPRTLQRSNELTQAAQAIVDANAREQFEAALRQLNEALTLNPNNTQAMTLKDRVQTQMGTGNVVLSSASEGEYQRAVRELQQGNTLVAMSIVETLLQNPQNRGSTRVLELQRRIQSVL